MENYKAINGYEGYYSISKEGNVLAHERKVNQGGRTLLIKSRFLNPGITSAGYFRLTLCRGGVCKRYLLHRLIALAYIPNENNLPCINHKNGVKTDNRIDNLEWCTREDNNRHAWGMGINMGVSGEKHHKAKLNWESVNEIRSSQKKTTELIEIFGVCRSTINRIRKNALWKN